MNGYYPGCGDSTPEPDPCQQPDWSAQQQVGRLLNRIKELLRVNQAQARMIQSLLAELEGDASHDAAADLRAEGAI